MDFGGFGSMGGGGLLGMLQSKFGGGGAAPAVPADGSMGPTIGPGMPAPMAAPLGSPGGYKPKIGLPSGGLLGMMQGGSPQGLMGLLQHLSKPGAAPGAVPGAPLAGSMPAAGMMMPGMPGSPMAGPVAPPQLPTDINPMNQF